MREGQLAGTLGVVWGWVWGGGLVVQGEGGLEVAAHESRWRRLREGGWRRLREGVAAMVLIVSRRDRSLVTLVCKGYFASDVDEG